MKSTAIFLILFVCLLQFAACTVTCKGKAKSACKKFVGHGRSCACDSLTSYSCVQNYHGYKGVCKGGDKHMLECAKFCLKGGHMCKGNSGPGTCEEKKKKK